MRRHNTDGAPRLRNWVYVRERVRAGELPWVRVEEIDGEQLKRPVVLVNGTFDLLHSAHWRLLFEARKRAGTLVCAMDSDRLVRANKGEKRPILTWVERATAMQYAPIDLLVEIGSDEDMRELVRRLRPDWRCQGADYAEQATRFPDIPRLFVRDDGMRTSTIKNIS